MKTNEPLDFPDTYATWYLADMWYRQARFTLFSRVLFAAAFAWLSWSLFADPAPIERPAGVSTPAADLKQYVLWFSMMFLAFLAWTIVKASIQFVERRNGVRELQARLEAMTLALKAGTLSLSPKQVEVFEYRNATNRAFLEVEVRTWRRLSYIAVAFAVVAIAYLGLAVGVGSSAVVIGWTLVKLISSTKRVAAVKKAESLPKRIEAM